MSPLHDESPAFRQALLRSERLRIFILFFAIGVAILFRLIRTVIAWTPENGRDLLWLILSATVLVLIELLVLRAIGPAIKSAGSLSRPYWLFNILLETCFPAVLIAFISSASIAPEFRPLVNPGFLLYFVLITLSTLRLNPAVSVLCGVCSVGTYLLAAYYHGWSPRWILIDASLFAPQKIVGTYAVSLLIAGSTAALVAREIRNQVEAALREAETRREVEHLQHDLDVARSIQQSLLPKSMPQIPGFDIAAWNKPADQTGGDYYDWQALPDGRILVALADVTGHGIGPALLASVCRAYSRSTFGQHNDFLKSMEQINTAIAADVGEGRFVTFVAAIMGPASSQVELLSAGHAPLFIYWLKHDRFDKMEAQGLPLGISPEFLSEPPQLLPFASGDLLVLSTDGFFEWANPSEELFGSERLENSVRTNRDKPAAEIISNLYQDVLNFAGGTAQKDDLTAIVIKRL
ncbi:MAG TPA: PP2C family protein-serine/threonine phosphatase [Candidatus Acidoferrum sp.]|nr:PP2C family protein-serine/threonine phosphatase [Candidatus Acidoferrum sp.]